MAIAESIVSLNDFDVHCQHCGCVGTLEIPDGYDESSIYLGGSQRAMATTTRHNDYIPKLDPMGMPIFEGYISKCMQNYKRILEDGGVKDVDSRMQHAYEHISSTNLGVTAFDAVKAFFDGRA